MEISLFSLAPIMAYFLAQNPQLISIGTKPHGPLKGGTANIHFGIPVPAGENIAVLPRPRKNRMDLNKFMFRIINEGAFVSKEQIHFLQRLMLLLGLTFQEEAIFLHSPVFPPVLWLPGASVGTPAGVNLGGSHEKKNP